MRCNNCCASYSTLNPSRKQRNPSSQYKMALIFCKYLETKWPYKTSRFLLSIVKLEFGKIWSHLRRVYYSRLLIFATKLLTLFEIMVEIFAVFIRVEGFLCLQYEFCVKKGESPFQKVQAVLCKYIYFLVFLRWHAQRPNVQSCLIPRQEKSCENVLRYKYSILLGVLLRLFHQTIAIHNNNINILTQIFREIMKGFRLIK